MVNFLPNKEFLVEPWFKLLVDDATYNQYYDMKSVLVAAPTLNKLAENAAKHPIIAEYLAEDGNLPFTGLNLLIWVKGLHLNTTITVKFFWSSFIKLR